MGWKCQQCKYECAKLMTKIKHEEKTMHEMVDCFEVETLGFEII